MRLIDADALLEIYEQNSITDIITVRDKTVRQHLKDAPAIYAVPVVHAAWVSEIVEKRDWKGRKQHYYQPCSCSACHEPAFREYKFCPFCGARMDGEANVCKGD